MSERFMHAAIALAAKCAESNPSLREAQAIALELAHNRGLDECDCDALLSAAKAFTAPHEAEFASAAASEPISGTIRITSCNTASYYYRLPFDTSAQQPSKIDDARTWFEQGLTKTEQLAANEPTNPRRQRELAIFYDVLGDIAMVANDSKDAYVWFEHGLAVRKQLQTVSPADAEWQRELSMSYDKLGNAAIVTGNLEEAHTWFERGLAVRASLAVADPFNDGAQNELAMSYDQLGDVALACGRLDEARAYFGRSVTIRSRLFTYGFIRTPGRSGVIDLVMSEESSATDQTNSTGPSSTFILWGETKSSARLSRALDLHLADNGDDSTQGVSYDRVRACLAANVDGHRKLLASYNKLASIAIAEARRDEATSWFEKSLAICTKIAAAEPSNIIWQHELAVLHDRLGDMAATTGQLSGARAWFEKGLAIRKALATLQNITNNLRWTSGLISAGLGEPKVDWQRELSVSYDKLGAIALAGGQLDETRAWLEQSLAVRRKLADATPANTGRQRELSRSYDKLGDVAIAAGRLDEALGWLEQGLAVRKGLAAADPANIELQRELSILLDKLGEVSVAAGQRGDARSLLVESRRESNTMRPRLFRACLSPLDVLQNSNVWGHIHTQSHGRCIEISYGQPSFKELPIRSDSWDNLVRSQALARDWSRIAVPQMECATGLHIPGQLHTGDCLRKVLKVMSRACATAGVARHEFAWHPFTERDIDISWSSPEPWLNSEVITSTLEELVILGRISRTPPQLFVSYLLDTLARSRQRDWSSTFSRFLSCVQPRAGAYLDAHRTLLTFQSLSALIVAVMFDRLGRVARTTDPHPPRQIDAFRLLSTERAGNTERTSVITIGAWSPDSAWASISGGHSFDFQE